MSLNFHSEESARRKVARQAAEFQNKTVHEKWDSVYRQGEAQSAFNYALTDRILSYFPDGATILDAGCGTGNHTRRFAQRGHPCIGVDVSAYAIRQAQRLTAPESKIEYRQLSLLDLSAIREGFDAIHCRGVLMHIGDWETALHEICGKLNPGGRIIIIENNDKAVEARLVRFIRRFRKSDSLMVGTPTGYEFRATLEGNVSLWRVANIKYLISKLREYGSEPISRFATEFWDLNRFPQGVARNLAVSFNRLYFKLGLPSYFSLGNAVVAEKKK